ncbi:MAG: hypothetical protein QM765_15485 [Myxococcales bacterium]
MRLGRLGELLLLLVHDPQALGVRQEGAHDRRALALDLLDVRPKHGEGLAVARLDDGADGVGVG